MNVFDHPEFDQHESLHYFQDPATGLKAIIAIVALIVVFALVNQFVG